MGKKLGHGLLHQRHGDGLLGGVRGVKDIEGDQLGGVSHSHSSSVPQPIPLAP
jgi:hypothetical protein